MPLFSPAIHHRVHRSSRQMSKNGQTSRQERSIDPGRSKHRFRLTCRYRCAGRRSRFAQIECKMSVNLVLVSCNIHASVMMVNKGWKADFPTTTLPRSHSGPAVGQRLKHLLHSRQNKHTVMTISYSLFSRWLFS